MEVEDKAGEGHVDQGSPEGLGPEGNQGSAPEGSVEGGEGSGQGDNKKVDDRGVPLENKVAELERKLTKALGNNDKLEELIEEIKKNNQTKTEEDSPDSPSNIFDSLENDVTDEEFEAAGFQEEHIKLLRRAIAAGSQKTTISAIKKADRERKQVEAMRKKVSERRTKNIRKVAEDLDPEFGGLIVNRPGGGWDWDRKSPLFKRASEIWSQDKSLQQDPMGEAEAARKAYLELHREKYGKEKSPGLNKLNKSQRMLGSSSGSGGSRSGPMKDTDGNFIRELHEDEVLALPPADRTKYLTASVMKGWNKPK